MMATKIARINYALITIFLAILLIVFFAVGFSFDETYAEAETYTYELKEYDNTHGNVTITRSETDSNKLLIKVEQEDTYAFNLIIKSKANGISLLEYNYSYNDNEFNKNEIEYTMSENVTIEVSFSKTYLIRFFLYDGGDLLVSYRYRAGETVSYADVKPIRTDSTHYYRFKNWYPNITSSDPVTKDQDYYGEYEVSSKLYIVVFRVGDDENGYEVISSKRYFPGDKVEIPKDPKKASDAKYDYEFAGWDYLVQDAYFDAVYTAVFNPILRAYPVHLETKNGSIELDINQELYDYGTKITVNPIPDKGYKVKRIYSKDNRGETDAVDNKIEVKGETTICVEFEKIFITYVDDEKQIEISYAYLDLLDDPIFNIEWMVESKYNIYSIWSNLGHKQSYVLSISIQDKEGNVITNTIEPITITLKAPYVDENANFYQINKEKFKDYEYELTEDKITFSFTNLDNEYVYCKTVTYSKGVQAGYILLVIAFLGVAISVVVLCAIEMFKKPKNEEAKND